MNEAERREIYKYTFFVLYWNLIFKDEPCNPIPNFVCYKHKAELAAATSRNPCFTSSISAAVYINSKSRGRAKEYDRSWACVGAGVYFYIAKLEEFSQHFLCSPTRANGSGTALRRTFLYTQQLVFIMDSVIKHRRWDRCALWKIHIGGAERKSEKSFSFSKQTVLFVTLKRFSGSCGGIIAARINSSRARCEIENR